MATVLEFKPHRAVRRTDRNDGEAEGAVVIFPGVRIERHDLDLGHRLVNAAGIQIFEGLGPAPRPRRTS